MKETIEEFGTAMICCIVGLIVIGGLGVLMSKTGLLAQFAEAFSNYFYGASQ